MTEEKTEEEIIRNCGYIDCVRIDHPKRKWFPSDKAILKENLIKDYVLIEDVEKIIDNEFQIEIKSATIQGFIDTKRTLEILRMLVKGKLKSRGRE